MLPPNYHRLAVGIILVLAILVAYYFIGVDAFLRANPQFK